MRLPVALPRNPSILQENNHVFRQALRCKRRTSALSDIQVKVARVLRIIHGLRKIHHDQENASQMRPSIERCMYQLRSAAYPLVSNTKRLPKTKTSRGANKIESRSRTETNRYFIRLLLHRYAVNEGGATEGSAPSSLLGAAPSVKTRCAPLAISVCLTHRRSSGLPLSVTDWMYASSTEVRFASITSSRPPPTRTLARLKRGAVRTYVALTGSTA